jgi:NifU-like protein involved in Fe-S cluster formation
MAYSATFKDHIANPRNAGELPSANATGEESNPVCGDRMRISLRISEGRIEAAGFLAYGCPPTIVCGSVLTELITGKTVEEGLKFTRKDLVAAVGGLPSRKQHAAALAIETLRAALSTSGGKPTFPTAS